MYKLPVNRRWTSDYSSSEFGSFVAAQNIDLDKEGTLTLSHKSIAIYSQDDDGDFDRVQSISYLTGQGYVLITRDHAYLLNLNDGPTVTEIGSSPSFSANSDGVTWQARAYATHTTKLVYWDGSSWSDAVTGLTNSIPHPVCVLEHRNEIAVGNGNTVQTYNTSHSLQNTLTIPTDFEVQTIRAKGNDVFVGTRNKSGGEAKVFLWNASGSVAQAQYGVRASRVYSLCPYLDTIIAVVNTGQILRFSQGGFMPLKDSLGVEANFPVWYSNYLWEENDETSSEKVFNRGTVAEGDLLYINVGSGVQSNESRTLLHNFPSGVWCFDPKMGLYHKALPSSDQLQSNTVSSISNNVLTLGSSSQAQTGESFFIESVGSITGLSAGYTYYLIRVTATTFKLALTQADAYAGTNITVAGTANNEAVLIAKNNHIGSVNTSSAGAIATISPNDLQDTFLTGNLLWGSAGYKVNDVDAVFYSLNTFSQAFNVGYVITPKLRSDNIMETWQTLYQKLSGLNLDTDTIVVKYRTRERFGLPTFAAQGSYSSDTRLGSNTAYFDQIEVGDEVVLTKGIGAGRSAHIRAIDGAELMLDEAIPNASSTNEVEFYVSDFKKLSTITNDTENVENGFAQSGMDSTTGPWVQFKIELRGARPAIEELLVAHETAKAVV